MLEISTRLLGAILRRFLPGGAHNVQVRFRVGVGQKHGRRHARIDAKVRLCAVLGGNITAVTCRGERMFGPQVAPHKAR